MSSYIFFSFESYIIRKLAVIKLRRNERDFNNFKLKVKNLSKNFVEFKSRI